MFRKMINLIIIMFLGIIIDLSELLASAESVKEYAIVEQILGHSNYDNKVRPGVSIANTTTVYLNMYIIDISAVDEINMDYKIDMYFRQRWKDQRITSPQIKDKITLGYKFLDQLWVPDTFFPNEKTALLHDTTVPNVLLTLDTDGTVLYSQRLTLQLTCVLDLRRYPFDNQTCEMTMMSYGYRIEEIDLQWMSSSPVENGSLSLPEFKFTNIQLKNCTETFSTGTFSCLAVVVSLQREVSHHITQTYIPSILIVVLSWVAFWIDYNSVPARISIGLLTVLTITTQSSAIVARLPRVSYTKAIDVWMSTCLVFVFLAFVEYSLVNILARQKKPASVAPTVNKKEKEVEIDNLPEKKGFQEKPEAWNKEEKQFSLIPTRYHDQPALFMDVISRIFFPATFAIFNIVYWAVFYRV